MLKQYLVPLALIATIFTYTQAFPDEETHLGRALMESGRASLHVSAAAGHALVASGQATLAVSAVPLALSGAALTTLGNASTTAAIEMHKAAIAPVRGPLEITDESLISMPPDQALNH